MRLGSESDDAREPAGLYNVRRPFESSLVRTRCRCPEIALLRERRITGIPKFTSALIDVSIPELRSRALGYRVRLHGNVEIGRGKI
jgi:hypothetical protein